MRNSFSRLVRKEARSLLGIMAGFGAGPVLNLEVLGMFLEVGSKSDCSDLSWSARS